MQEKLLVADIFHQKHPVCPPHTGRYRWSSLPEGL